MPATRSRRDDKKVKPRADAYVGLLIISLLAMIAGCVLLALDWKDYPDSAEAQKALDRVKTRPAAPGGQPGGQIGGQPGGQVAGQPGGQVAGQPGGMMGGQPGGMMGGQPGGMMGGQPGGMMGGMPK